MPSRSGLQVDDYWRVRQELIDAQLNRIGRGRGGSIARIGAELQTSSKKNLVDDEKQLYEPLRSWLQKTFGQEVVDRGDLASAS